MLGFNLSHPNIGGISVHYERRTCIESAPKRVSFGGERLFSSPSTLQNMALLNAESESIVTNSFGLAAGFFLGHNFGVETHMVGIFKDGANQNPNAWSRK